MLKDNSRMELNEGHKSINFQKSYFCVFGVLFIFDILQNVRRLLVPVGVYSQKREIIVPSSADTCLLTEDSSFIKYSQRVQKGHLTMQ